MNAANTASGDETAPPPSKETELAKHHLWEACVEADWDRVSILCDEYSTARRRSDEHGEKEIDVTEDATLFSIIDGIGDENRRNPLMAAILHVAIDVAAAHRSFSLFSETVAQDLVDAEERKRLLQPRQPDVVTLEVPVTTADFCPYLQMRNYGDSNYPIIDEKHRRARRKAIAKLCRTNPLWILLPMIPRGRNRYEEDSNFDDELPRGTTALHVAVRSRNVMLTHLLIKYCPKSAEIADIDGCIPLHYAVRPADETTVLRRAVITFQRSLNRGVGNAPLEAGPNEVHSGVNLCYHGKTVFKATHESSGLARCRVRRLRRNHKLRALTSNMARFMGSGQRDNNVDSDKNLPSKKEQDKPDSKSENNSSGNNENEGSHGRDEKNGSKTFLNMYDTPSSLVRAMMYLGTVEEDSTDLVQSEWNTHEDINDKGLEARKSTIATECPIVLDTIRTVTHGLGRATRPWKMERHRFDVVKLLTSIHPQGMLYQNDDGGDTPLIIACQTLQGDEEMDEDFGDFLDDDMDDDPMDEVPDNGNAPIPDEIGEDEANYELDLPQPGEEEESPNAESDHGAQQSNNQADADQDDNAGGNDHEHPGPNNGEEGPLAAVLFMISENGSNAIGVPDDDGDTALHAATRIGASPRLVQQLLNTMPALASTPAEDGSSPLHLACRRACDLAPEGNGGMGTYDSEAIRLLSEAAGPGVLIAVDDEGRTPFHVACRYRASPTVLSVLADSEGARKSLLIRDTEGHHTPLGVYCRHASDYHGLRVLAERCPDAAAAMGDGRLLPLHVILATFNLAVNVDCLKLLGSAYPPGLDLASSRGLTPLALLCESYKSPLSVDIPKLISGRSVLERCLSNKIWLSARYLILAAKANIRWKAHVEQNSKELMLHATLREPSSSFEIVQLATIIHSDEISEREVDSNGDTALHLSCRRRQCGPTADSGSENDNNTSSDTTNDDVFKRVNEGIVINEELASPPQRQRNHNPGQDYLPILNHILQCDITAAGRCNNDEKLALNLLIDRGSTWRGGGVDIVLKASPKALFSYELSNALFVMALARTASFVNSDRPTEKEQASTIGATFELLRGKPTALEFASRRTVQSPISSGQRKSKRTRTK